MDFQQVKSHLLNFNIYPGCKTVSLTTLDRLITSTFKWYGEVWYGILDDYFVPVPQNGEQVFPVKYIFCPTSWEDMENDWPSENVILLRGGGNSLRK